MALEAEDSSFLTEQIITYIGNKRALIPYIAREVDVIADALGRERVACADLFSGSGIVARALKRRSETLFVNDLEEYSALINSCYLSNREDYPAEECDALRNEIDSRCAARKTPGIITENYAPQDDENIKIGERVFYTHENALLIDTYRALIDDVVRKEHLKKFFLAPLITEASVHVNTSGVFKGFYKDKRTGVGCFGGAGHNALTRIRGRIALRAPVLSRFSSDVRVFRRDAVELASELPPLDIAYLDPPYNQHPYGSNYFMLNLILKNRIEATLSPVSGIAQDWNRSAFNKPHLALRSLEEVVSRLDARYIIVSYNSEGFIKPDEMSAMLSRYGTFKTVEIPYNTFRGSRNLKNRDIHVTEYLYILKKRDAPHAL